MNEGWNVIVRYDESFAGVNVWLMKKEANRELIVKPVDLSIVAEYVQGYQAPEPTLRFYGNDARQFLQGLADGLVEAGFRPEALKVQGDVLTAVRAHLEDARANATKLLDTVLKMAAPATFIQK